MDCLIVEKLYYLHGYSVVGCSYYTCSSIKVVSAQPKQAGQSCKESSSSSKTTATITRSKRNFYHETIQQAEACGGRDWAQKLFYEEMKATTCVKTAAIFRPLLGHPALLPVPNDLHQHSNFRSTYRV